MTYGRGRVSRPIRESEPHLDGRMHGELAASNEKRLTAQAPLRCQGFVLASGFRLVAVGRGVGDAEAQVLDVVDGLVQQGGDVVVVEGVVDVLGWAGAADQAEGAERG